MAPMTATNPKYTPVVEQATPTLMAPIDVVNLAATLEQVATETYLADLNRYTDVTSRVLMASVMGVECQRLATLRAVAALLNGGAPDIDHDPHRRGGASGSGRQRRIPRCLQRRHHGRPHPKKEPSSGRPVHNPSLTRRNVLAAGAAMIGAGLIAATCGSDSSDSAVTAARPQRPVATPRPVPQERRRARRPTRPPPPPPRPLPNTTPDDTAAPDANVDLTVAALAAGLEVLAVGTYQAALDAAGAGSLGDRLPSESSSPSRWPSTKNTSTRGTRCSSGAGKAEVTEPNTTLKPTVDDAFAQVTDVVGAATLALMLEEIAAATYLNAQNVLTDPDSDHARRFDPGGRCAARSGPPLRARRVSGARHVRPDEDGRRRLIGSSGQRPPRNRALRSSDETWCCEAHDT